MNTVTPVNRVSPTVQAVVVVVSPTNTPQHASKRKTRAAACAVVLGITLALALQLMTGWAIRTDRIAVSDPQYAEKLLLLRARMAAADRAATAKQVLFLGSSRTFDAVNAKAASEQLARELGTPIEAFNFAHAGAGPVTTAIYFRRLLAEGITPHAVAIEVHPAFLAAQIQPPPETKWLSPVRLKPHEIATARELELPIASPAAHGSRGLYLAWFEYRIQLVERYAPALSTLQYRLGAGHEPDAHGFVRVRELPAEQRSRLLVLTKKQYDECWPNYEPGGSGIHGLRDVLQTCRAHGIRAMLYTTPESTVFRSWYGEPGFSHIAPKIAEVANEFGVPFCDAREWLPDELIGDGHHLIGTGADAFTARLCSESLVPWLKTQPKNP